MDHRAGDAQPGLFDDPIVVTVRELKVSAKITTATLNPPLLVQDIVRKVVPRGVRWWDPTIGEWTIGLSHLQHLMHALTVAGVDVEVTS
jgi:hypothetical protein